MGIPTYTAGYPPDGSSLGQTKAVIRDNLDGSFETLGVDHVNNNGIAQSIPLSGNPAGYHTIIHQVTQASDPPRIAGVNQIYSKLATIPGGDTQLFTRTGGGGISQLTGSKSADNGYVWDAGILIQWGRFNFTAGLAHDTNTVLFSTLNVTFPNACFIVIPQLIVTATATTTASNTLAIQSKSAASFVYVFNSSSSTGSTQYPGFYWVAIGN